MSIYIHMYIYIHTYKSVYVVSTYSIPKPEIPSLDSQTPPKAIAEAGADPRARSPAGEVCHRPPAGHEGEGGFESGVLSGLGFRGLGFWV